MGKTPISPDVVISDLLAQHPDCTRAFIDHKMLCVGCAFSRFHSVEYACEKHGVDLESFLARIEAISDPDTNDGSHAVRSSMTQKP